MVGRMGGGNAKGGGEGKGGKERRREGENSCISVQNVCVPK